MASPHAPREAAKRSAREMAEALANYLRWRRETSSLYYLPRSEAGALESSPISPAVSSSTLPVDSPNQGGVANADSGFRGQTAGVSQARPQREDSSPPASSFSREEKPRSSTPSSPELLKPGSALAEPESEPSTSRRKEAQSWSAARKLRYLQERVVGDCQRCALAKSRKHLVFGVGNPEARIMFVGEAPGADEDRLGEPFVGAAGQRLNQWLAHFELSRDEVYIANVLKCRPPRNRDPEAGEIALCSTFLRAQIRAISPQALVALGRFAGALLLGRPGMRMYEMRGGVHEYRDPKLEGRVIPVVVTYHPSYILRRERDQKAFPSGDVQRCEDENKVLADLQRALSAQAGDARS